MHGLLQVLPLIPRISRRRLSHHEVTTRFLDFFKERQHAIVPSSPLLAPPETGILFTNSGMNQFHRILSGYESPTVKRVASLQDCVRVGGKHNDLLEVGQDGHHHTFFQMLGNWSFGDYSKDEACALALELLSDGYHLKKEDLVVTYFGGDPNLGISPDFDTKEIWLKLGLSPASVLAKGIEDNFWEMGKTGPCGPCTEIHVKVDGQLREIWNLVFIQYNRMSDGSLRPLEVPFVDTGMGLERLCALLQGKSSNYDTDLFTPLIKFLEKESGKTYTGSYTSAEDAAFRLVSDHCRMATKSISQGILPEHVDSGNKLRRVLRRASHAAHDRLNLQPGTLGNLSRIAADSLGLQNVESIKSVIDDEERRYLMTLKNANRFLREEGDVETLSGSTAWKLYQLCGLPRDNITDICTQRGIKSVDWVQFDKHLEDFKRKSVGPDAFARFNLPKHADATVKRNHPATNYSAVYGNQHELRSNVLYAAQEASDCVIVTRETCFYPESGGQASDVGTIAYEDSELEVLRVVKIGDHLFHLCRGRSPPEASTVRLKVDGTRRQNCTYHHTACHLLNAAVKKQLGIGAVQKSSSVDDEHFRLDIASKAAVDVQSVEDFINEAINSNLAVKCKEVAREDIMGDPSIVKLPNEIYPPRVRLVQCGEVSREPCCGTHVAATGQIPPVVILGSRSAGANVKIITATASRASLARDNAEHLRVEVEKLDAFSNSLTDDFREAKAARDRLRSLRNFVAAELLPQLAKTSALKRLDVIETRIVKCTRLSNKLLEPEVRSRLMALSGSPIAGIIACDCDNAVVRRILKDRDEPHFIVLESCGKLHVTCKVSKQAPFTAKQWVDTFLELIDSPEVWHDDQTDYFCRFRIDTTLPADQLVQTSRAAFDKLTTEKDDHADVHQSQEGQ